MNRHDLTLLGRTPQGLEAAMHRIFCQPELEESDHEFLLERLESLDKAVLLCWLDRRPPYPIKVAQALVEQIRKYDFVFEILGFADHAACMPKEALDEIIQGTRGLMPDGRWWHVARHVQGGCSTFRAALGDQWYWRIVDRLFPHRHDEDACRREIVQMVREADIEARMLLLRWMEANGLLDIVSPADALPSEVAFPFECGIGERRESDGYFLMLAKKWRDRPEAREWLLSQSFAAVKRGVDWSTVWWVLPAALQDEMALRTLDTEMMAPWIVFTLVEAAERGEAGVLEHLVFPNLEKLIAIPRPRDIGPFLGKIKFMPNEFMRAVGINPDEHREIPRDKLWTIVDPGQSLHTWAFCHAPLPDDESLDEMILERARNFGTIYRSGMVHRMSQLPLTRNRANRVLAWAIDDDKLFEGGHVSEEAILRLVEFADPLPSERLPSVDAFFWHKQTDEGFAAYRKLGGEVAMKRLRAWALAPIEQEGNILEAIHRMRLLPEFSVDELAAVVVPFVKTASIRELWRIREKLPQFVTEERLVEAALACAEDLTERWYVRTDQTITIAFAEAIRRRVRVVERETDWDELMEWLEKHEEPHGKMLEHTMCFLEGHPQSYVAMNWLRKFFVNRTRWTQFGPRVLGWLLETQNTHTVWGFIERTFVEDTSAAVNLPGMQEALAVVLVKRASQGIMTNNEQVAIAALNGLVALHPPTRIAAKVRGLRKMGKLSPAIEDLVALNERLLRHDSTREANWIDARAALSLYVDGLRAND